MLVSERMPAFFAACAGATYSREDDATQSNLRRQISCCIKPKHQIVLLPGEIFLKSSVPLIAILVVQSRTTYIFRTEQHEKVKASQAR